MRNKPIVLVTGILFLLIGGFATTRKPRPPDQSLVALQADNIVKAFNRGDNGGILSCVSPNFESGGWTKTRLQIAMMRWKRQGIQATIIQSSVSQSGKGEFTVAANLQARDTNTQDGVWSAPEAKLIFRLERPVPDIPFLPGTWRLVSVAGASLPESSTSD